MRTFAQFFLKIKYNVLKKTKKLDSIVIERKTQTVFILLSLFTLSQVHSGRQSTLRTLWMHTFLGKEAGQGFLSHGNPNDLLRRLAPISSSDDNVKVILN